jgi:hypothetical protein
MRMGQRTRENRIAEAEAFVRRVLILLGNAPDEATVRAVASKVLKTMPPYGRGCSMGTLPSAQTGTKRQPTR